MKTIFMPKETWEKWDTALRSGEYKQGTKMLHNKAECSYCCLGVLQQVVSGYIQKDEDGEEVPDIHWLDENGIKFIGPYCQHATDPQLMDDEDSGELARVTAAQLNDRGSTFIEIADAVKECVSFTDSEIPA